MKLTKRQLKRIIREEYNRLKRRGLIRETGRKPRKVAPGVYDHRSPSSMGQQSLEDMDREICIEECFAAVPAMMKKICKMGMAHTVTNDIYHICAPICQKYGCDADDVSQIVEGMCCR